LKGLNRNGIYIKFTHRTLECSCQRQKWDTDLSALSTFNAKGPCHVKHLCQGTEGIVKRDYSPNIPFREGKDICHYQQQHPLTKLMMDHKYSSLAADLDQISPLNAHCVLFFPSDVRYLTYPSYVVDWKLSCLCCASL